MEARYFQGPDGDCLMLHNPDESQIEALEDMGAEEIAAARKRIRSARGLARFRPVLVKRDVDRDALGRLLDAMAVYDLAGVREEAGHARAYPFGVVGAQVKPASGRWRTV